MTFFLIITRFNGKEETKVLFESQYCRPVKKCALLKMCIVEFSSLLFLDRREAVTEINTH